MSMLTAIISSIEDEGSPFLPSIHYDFMDSASTGLKKAENVNFRIVSTHDNKFEH